MRNIKKITCFALALVLLALSLNISAFAENDVDSNLISALQGLEEVKHEYGLSNVNFENFEIGRPIHCYNYTVNGFVECYQCYPLLIEDELKMFAIKIDDTENSNYQLTIEYAQKINSMVSNSTDFAIVFGCDGAYIYDGKNFTLISETNWQDDERLSISESVILPSTTNIVLENMDNAVSANYSSSNKNARIPIYYGCSVSIVPQSHSLTCWAACVACIVNYKNGTNLTDVDVARSYLGDTFNVAQSGDSIVTVLSTYGLSYSYKSVVPSLGTMTTNFKAGYPIIGALSDHVVIIYGVHVSSEYVYIMDPDSNENSVSELGYLHSFTATYSTVSNTYVYYKGGYLQKIQKGICAYWDNQ
ncbi:MAG: hypothetical protein IJX39_06975 [Clostridia bacterium]|nr:hypothetical protein [Clostridia bacterium]